MAKLAIKGHSTRGSEVIALLEMLGGKNTAHFKGEKAGLAYYIEVDKSICCIDFEFEYHTEFYKITVEEFEEKFPYKVGDKVSSKYLKNYEISKMEWESINNRVIYKLREMGWYSADELQPYKEETMEKINIAELLKDCPKGMELDCTMYDNCTYAGIEDVGYIDILINTPSGRIRLTKEGCYIRHDDNAKCVIFPKGKTTWEGFVPPYQFKDGDIVVTTLGNIAIIRKPIGEELFYIYGLMVGNGFYKDETAKVVVERLASEEEKQKLFDAIKDNGYRWNAETKTLEELVEPKFKVGDRIQSKDFIEERTIKICEEDGYWTTVDTWIRISDQDDWELVPNKFDIATLKPFDKVFVRDNNTQEWVISFFSHCNGLEIYKYSCINGSGYAQCVPYEENKHLLGTTNDCDDFYKTWEK